MDIAGDGERECPHRGPLGRRLRQQRWLRMCLLQVLENGEGLRERVLTVHQHRDETKGVECPELARVLRAPRRAQIHDFGLPGDALEAERDAHAVGRRAAEVAVQLHDPLGGAMVLRSTSSPSMPPSRRSPGFTAPTPEGVPVKMRSPAHSSYNRESDAMIIGTSHSIRLTFDSWRRVPFTLNQMRPR